MVQLYIRLLPGRFQVRILVAEPLSSKSALFRPTGFVEPRESRLGMILPRSSLHGVGVGAGLTGGRRKPPRLARMTMIRSQVSSKNACRACYAVDVA